MAETTNTFLTRAEIAYESADILMNAMPFTGMLNRQYVSQFAQAGAKIGDQFAIRLPPRFIPSDGPVATFQNIVETQVILRVNRYKTIPLSYSGQDLVLSMDNFSDRYLKPALVQLANEVDRVNLSDLLDQVYNAKGTPGAVPNDTALFLDAKARMLDEATPDDDTWIAVITPRTQSGMVKAMQGLFNDQGRVSEQFRRGHLGKSTLGYDFYVSQNLSTHINGPLGGTPLIDGANQTGSAILTKGWTAAAASRLLKGDRVTFAGVFIVNPLTRRSTGELRQFVLTSNFSSDVSGNGIINIDPPLTPVDALGNVVQFQTVSASPADSAAITVLGAANVNTPMNICFHPDFATVAFVDLPMPKSGLGYRLQDPDLNIAFRIWEDSEFTTDVHGVRLDILFGNIAIYPQWACVVHS